MNELQAYMVHEYVADHKAGYLSRRDLVRRVLNITGGLGSTATILLALGCQPAAPPAATSTTPPKPTSAPAVSPAPSPSPAASPKPAASPSASPAAAPAVSPVASPSPAARSPLSVAANDPTIDGQDITITGRGGTGIKAYQARLKSASGPLPLVLVCHENRGLTEHIRDVTRRLAKENFTACAIDLLSLLGGTAKITDPNQFSAVLTGPNVDPDQFVDDFASAVAFYKKKPDLVDAAKIGMTGFCFGGGITWRATEQIDDLKAAAPYYGAFPPLDQVGTIKAAVLGVYSSDPNDFANTGRDDLDQALSAAGVTHTFKVYPGTMHAFHNDTGPNYNQEQALAAWGDTVAWFKQYLA